MDIPDWHWNEIQQVGTDFADVEEVESYDARMASFRDVDGENRQILETLALPPGAAIVEIGCGTGRFARAAAGAGHQVTAVDVSPTMLEYVRQRAHEEGLTGLETHHAGFLTMDLPPDLFDAAVSVACLHHLPDAWKLVGLERVRRLLKPGGHFFLGDVVFSIEPGQAFAKFERFVSEFPAEIRAGATVHVAREYSTLDWIMAGLLERAGFQILSQERLPSSFICYHCRRD